jgi:uncharacterized DUF497 family protein
MTGAPFTDIARALKKQADILAENAADVEHRAAAIGLSAGATGRVIFESRRQAELISEAHHIFKSLLPVEATVRAIIAEAA